MNVNDKHTGKWKKNAVIASCCVYCWALRVRFEGKVACAIDWFPLIESEAYEVDVLEYVFFFSFKYVLFLHIVALLFDCSIRVPTDQ